MAEGFHSVADEETLKRVLDLAGKAKSAPKGDNGKPPAAFENYLGQLVRYATGEDRYWDEPDALLARALETWSLSKKRKIGEQFLSLTLRESEDWRETRLVLDIVTDDKPFLVDSITAALAELGKPVSFFANAIVDVERDAKGQRLDDGDGTPVRESMIHAEMDPPVDDAEIEALDAEIRRVLDDVAFAVADWEPMRARLGACIAQLETSRPPGVEREEQRESVEFLKWLWDNRFAFLGARYYHYEKTKDGVSFIRDEEKDLGILKDSDRRILRSTFLDSGAPSPAVEDFMNSGEPIIIAKANAKSLVHRRVYMDYVGVKSYAVDGTVIGEDRFVGLFTSEAYNRPASDIPLLRSKVRKVVEEAQFVPGGHNEKAIVNILETFPRDEMFQDDIDSLRETSLGILRLYKRPRVKLFMRRDRFDRFISALVFIPRDRFSSTVRENIGQLLADTFDGRVSAFYPHFGDAALVRVHFIIGLNPGAPEGPGIAALTREIRALSIDWGDELLEELRNENEGATPQGLFSRYKKAFDAGYRERTSPHDALIDIAEIESVGDDRPNIRVYRAQDDAKAELSIKIYKRGEALRLSDLIPKLENLGFNVIQEYSHFIRPYPRESGGKARDAETYWIHDFHTEEKQKRPVDASSVKSILEEAFGAVLDGATEDDAFNALVLLAGLHWREAWILRAAAKYHLQGGFPFSQAYIEETLAKHPEIARTLVTVFHARFNPSGPAKAAARKKEVADAEAQIFKLLEEVHSLDEDRIVRRYLALFAAILRTNFYQCGEDGSLKDYISFKIDSQAIADLPDPKPYREIFVSSPRVDGVHLRFGPVARGGLRWSDRKEDFRTEVLGLVKAQRVKNAVIVPTGSKGGFYPKQLPPGGDRNAIYEEGREAYKVFIRGLLDITDNIVGGKTTPPADTVMWDDPDPYLVVAADKGTAQFSDTANGISQEYGFWLGDAFASGGSAGYDHKVMGITARGAWEAVKRHFREMGKNIQAEPFTVAGVGDMSGDVFGNGMLLSEQIKLVAAFDHRDIFVDPAPDPATSYAERLRLFETPRSSWQDYNAKLISKGGGVFSRNAKSLKISPEMQSALDIKASALTPAELIKAILKARVELFWLGGIGTYFKDQGEENSRVGDRANDAVRIDASEMRMKVIGEGANLGLTQAARITFARNGGRINTDAIDNSAGVDSSDHEVNIKILVSSAIEQAELKREDRDELLKSMTEDVAEHVLQHNYVQTRALTLLSDTAPHDLEAQARLMTALENQGRLDRAIEGLPDQEKLAELRARGLGLTRPELSVLLAYAKIWLFEEMIDSSAPDDPELERELFGYFPEALHQFKHPLVKHRLRREIIATRLSNEIVDTCGPTFAHRVVEASGAQFADMVLAYEGARRILSLGYFGADVDALDNLVPASLQTSLFATAVNLLSEQVYRIVRDAGASALIESRGLKGLTDQYKAPVNEFKEALHKILPPSAAKDLKARRVAWRKAGAPENIANEAALMPALEFAFDVVNLSRDTKWSAINIGAVFFAVGNRFKIDSVRAVVRNTPPESHYDRLALRRLTEDLTGRQGDLAKNIAKFTDTEPNGDAAKWLDQVIGDWRAKNSAEIERFERYVGDLDLNAGVSVGKLSLLSQKLADLVERT